MENAAEALKLAGFTLLFVTALAIAMITVMKAKNTSEDIIAYSDKTRYYSTVKKTTSTDEFGNRVVSVYDIIPTLYRYQQEQYIILFYDNGNALKVSEEQSKTGKAIAYLNYNLEDKNEEIWRNNINSHVKNIVKYLLEKGYTFTETIGTTDNKYYNNIGIESILKLRRFLIWETHLQL